MARKPTAQMALIDHLNTRWKDAATLANQTGLTESSARKALRRLVVKGLAMVERRGKKFVYRTHARDFSKAERTHIPREKKSEETALDTVLAGVPLSEVALWLAEKLED